MGFNIKWIGQGGYLFSIGKKVLCVDPYLSNSVRDVEGLERLIPIPIDPQELKADMVISTHDHIDHLDEESIKHMNLANSVFAGPKTCVEHFMAMGIPENRLLQLNAGDSIPLGDAVINGVYANHTPDSIGVVIQYNGYTVYIVGDSLYDEKLLDAGKYNPDILISCINGRWGNMGYDDAASLAIKLGVKVAIPSHYGMFAENTEDPDKFKDALKNSCIRYFELEYNQKYSIDDIMGDN